MRTTIARSAAEIEALRPAWERLCRAARHTIFQSFRWNLLAARMFADREAPRVVHVAGTGGEAIIPGCVTADGRLSLLGEALFDYRDVLQAGDESLLRHAWGVLAREGSGFSLTALRGAVRCQWQALGFAPAAFCNAPCVTRDEISAEAFASRHVQAGRRLRQLARAGVNVRVHAGSESVLVRHIYSRKARQPQPGPNLFSDPARLEFAVALANDPACEVLTLEDHASVVAALVAFTDGRIRRFYTTYYDEAWSRYSPGIALLFESTRRSLAQGLDCDYMTGEQAHKIRFATSAVPLFRVNATAAQLEAIELGRPAVELAA